MSGFYVHPGDWQAVYAKAREDAAEVKRLREAIDQALGLIETASSRNRIHQARDVLRAGLSRTDRGSNALSVEDQ